MVGLLVLVATRGVAAQTAARETGAAVVGAAAAVPAETWLVRRGDVEVVREAVRRDGVNVSGELRTEGATPRFTQWNAVLAPEGTAVLLNVVEREGEGTGKERSRVLQRVRIIIRPDSVSMEAMTNGGLQMRFYPTRPGAFPYLNLSFGMMELAVAKALPAPGASGSLAFFNLGGGQLAEATIRRPAADSAVVALGTTEFRFLLDAAGRPVRGAIPAQGVTFERR